ncbi:hypothetical protein ZWY2020_010111 [Hordeum vulgare]|nr:hypothetical protein ZWY2020_010111 [Hordeum vulgare]
MYDQSHVMKMLCDPEIVKDVHLYVSKEKAGDDVAPPSKQFDIALSNHPNESVLLREGGVYAEGEGTGQLTMKRPQRPLRRSKRLNVIQENLQSNVNGISRLPILHSQRKRIQCNGPVEARSSMQHDISEDNNLPHLHEKAGDHDVNQLQIQENSSSPHGLVIDSVPEVREMRDPTGESFSRQNQQGTRTVHPHMARSRKRHTPTIKIREKDN